MMDHRINIEEEILPSSSTGLEKANPKIVDSVNEKIHRLPPLCSEDASIFRVHNGLRLVNEEAYTPMFVSIGPYHHENPKLQGMEEYKLRCLHSILERNGEKSAERYILLMEKLEDRARGFYADPICLEKEKFVEMMLLDACFVIEILQNYKSKVMGGYKDDARLGSRWVTGQILCDMMLLENQLPLFVLFEFFKMITGFPDSTSFMNFTKLSLISIYRFFFSNFSSFPSIQLEDIPTRESKHFLDLLHKFICLYSCQKASPNENFKSIRIPCLTELQEAGVSFQVDNRDGLSLFDVNFEHGRLKIPKFRVDDFSEKLLRNIIAYEQHSSEVKFKYFSDYTFFLDQLINTERDVTALRLYGIMESWLGDDEKVAGIFNKMGDGRFVNTKTYYYSEVSQKLNDHCEKGWNKAMAKLRHNYFNNPWASVSTIAAVFLISLTLIQTVATLKPLIH